MWQSPIYKKTKLHFPWKRTLNKLTQACVSLRNFLTILHISTEQNHSSLQCVNIHFKLSTLENIYRQEENSKTIIPIVLHSFWLWCHCTISALCETERHFKWDSDPEIWWVSFGPCMGKIVDHKYWLRERCHSFNVYWLGTRLKVQEERGRKGQRETGAKGERGEKERYKGIGK